MAKDRELQDQIKLREKANSLIERAGDLEQRNIGLAAKLTEKLKESVSEIGESFQDLGIGDSIRDALNISNKYVQAFSKKLLPGLFGSVVTSARKLKLSVTNAWSGLTMFGTGSQADAELFRENLEEVGNEIKRLKSLEETKFGLDPADAFLSKERIKERTTLQSKIKENEAAQEKYNKALSAVESNTFGAKWGRALAGIGTAITAAGIAWKPSVLHSKALAKNIEEIGRLEEKLTDPTNIYGGKEAIADAEKLNKLKEKNTAIQTELDKRAAKSGQFQSAVLSGAKKGAVGAALFAGGLIVGLLGLIGKAFSMAFDRLNEVENAVINIRKQFGFSNRRVQQFADYIDATRGDFLAIGLSSDDVASNIGGMVSVLGESRKITNDEITLINELNARLGISAESASGVLNVFQLFGPETQKQSAAAVAALVGMANAAGIGFNTVAQDLSDNAEQILTSFSGYDIELSKAALQARMLGLDIGRVGSISEGLLDFESSITAEMKAEVLLGRQINLGRLRGAALMGDAEGMAQGLADLTREIGSLDNMNYYQKKALAEATGLSVLELQKAFKLQTQLGRLTAEEQKQFAALSDAQQKQVQQEESLEIGLKRVRNMEPLLNSVEKLKAKWRALVDIIARPLSRVVGIIAKKFDGILGRIREQIDSGELVAAFERFGAVVGRIMDKLFDSEFIDKVTNFINSSIAWVKKIANAATSFFGGVGGVGGKGGGTDTSFMDPSTKPQGGPQATETSFMGPSTKPQATETKQKANDGVIHAGKIITTHPEDYLIATKNPKDLVPSPMVVTQEFPPDLMKMIKMNNELLGSLLANGIDARIAPKQVSKAVYSQNNVR